MATLLLVASFTFLVVRFSRHTAARLGVLCERNEAAEKAPVPAGV